MERLISEEEIVNNYENAKSIFYQLGVKTDDVIEKMKSIQISLHCWQGDDIKGFEKLSSSNSGGGILATGNYSGRARNGNELRDDLQMAMSLIPGKQRANLHSMYAEDNGNQVERDSYDVSHFSKWIKWAKEMGIGIDFNPTFFSHPNAESGFTLSSTDESIRAFWIKHAKACRKIASEIGKSLGSTSTNNLWIPDGYKDIPANRLLHRRLLKDSLDQIFEDNYDHKYLLDSVESKLFGIGSESFVVGSHEFYMGYAMEKNLMLCLDMGHFHPTESVADKISSLLCFNDKLLIHISRGVRWDSDHVVILNDDVISVAQEVKRCDALDKVKFALDYFDASINRIAAWVIGSRALSKAILQALLEPSHILNEVEKGANYTKRLALLEEFKTLPYNAVWDKYCLDEGVPEGQTWLNRVLEYEKNVLSER